MSDAGGDSFTSTYSRLLSLLTGPCTNADLAALESEPTIRTLFRHSGRVRHEFEDEETFVGFWKALRSYRQCDHANEVRLQEHRSSPTLTLDGDR